jgi:hypothetical protein
LREAALVVGGQRAVTLGVGVRFEDVLVGRDEEPGSATGWIEHGLRLLWVDYLNDEIDDVARGTELSGVSLGAEH